MDLGRALITYITLREAAQEGAAYASIFRENITDPNTCQDVIDRVRGTSTAPVNLSDTANIDVLVNFNGSNCSSGAVPVNSCFGQDVSVEVRFNNFPLVTPFLGTILGTQDITISALAIDTVLTPACQ